MKYILSILALLFIWSSLVSASTGAVTYVPGIKRWLGWTGTVVLGADMILWDDMLLVHAKTWSGYKDSTMIHSLIRVSLIKQLLHNRTVTFYDKPYNVYPNFSVTVRSGAVVASEIDVKDDLDRMIIRTLRQAYSGSSYINSPKTLVFSKAAIQKLWPLYLWKDSRELRELGYEVLSSRYRTNTDPAYRRHNIITAFSFLGHTRVLNPGDSVKFLASINYDGKAQKNYKNGLAIVQDEEIPVYGWWICWWSTALYQWLLTNKWLKLDAKNHSKRFTNLYTATINGTKIATPWLDATVFAGSRDLIVTNISDYPIIIVANYNGQYGGIEEIMSLGMKQDKGSVEFVSQNTKWTSKTTPAKEGTGVIVEKFKTGCYTWTINGVNKTSCYREIH